MRPDTTKPARKGAVMGQVAAAPRPTVLGAALIMCVLSLPLWLALGLWALFAG